MRGAGPRALPTFKLFLFARFWEPCYTRAASESLKPASSQGLSDQPQSQVDFFVPAML